MKNHEKTSSADAFARDRGPNYRRPVSKPGAFFAVAVTLGGLGFGGYKAVESLGRVNASIPTIGQANEHPDDFEYRITRPGDTLWDIAEEYTDKNHNIQDNTQRLIDQNGGEEAIQPGEVFIVPPTTVPEDERSGQ